MIERKKTKVINIGGVLVGGDNKIAIQSMTNTKTSDVKATVNQIKELEEAGCDIVRLAVPDSDACGALKEITKSVSIPVVADIHFDYRLAIGAMENGVSKIRINPGNIGADDRLKAVIDVAKERNIPIRVGVNSGSVQKEILAKYGGPTVEAIVESAITYKKKIEDMDFNNMVFSLKSSSVLNTIKGYELFSQKEDYPLHIGLTEAGTAFSGTVKSSVALGTLLSSGIGDTIRVSLTDNPVEEIYVAKEILKSLELLKGGISFVSCPTCGRTKIDLISIAKEVEDRLKNVDKDIKVAIMGCAVNGPGEAKEADIGIAGGDGNAVIFKKGVIVKTVDSSKVVDELIAEIDNM